ncbi:MAG TPA: DUF1631 family protein [Burkholderiaceae bacterium]|jgi:hypothetical protein
MTLNDPRSQATLDAAMNPIRVTLSVVSGRVAETLAAQASSTGRLAERDMFAATQLELRRNLAVLRNVFANELNTRVADDLAPPRAEGRRALASADWQTLSLVDDAEMEERMYADRIGQQISHACEAELRELSGYMSSLLRRGGAADPDRNPLRPELLGTALYRAIEAVTKETEPRKLLARELGAAMAKAMPECYTEMQRILQANGVQPKELSVRQVEGPGNQLGGINSAYETQSLQSASGNFDDYASGEDEAYYSGQSGGHGGGPGGYGSNSGGPHGGHDQRSSRRGGGSLHDPALPGGSGRRGTRTGPSSGSGSGSSARGGLTPRQADAQMMALLRHLSAVSRSAELDSGTRPSGRHTRSGPGSALGTAHGSSSSSGIGGSGAGIGAGASTAYDRVAEPVAYAADGYTGLMAVNLIRAHREELVQAATGKLDHMVIDVVGSLFDQILSDTRVPPQMAREIARLQLPVLRVALNDETFFSSRRHPVRRFVNRIASLACAFDDFDEGPGKQFLERVRTLIQEIIDGDFDQVEVYTAKLAALEAFIAEQTHQAPGNQAAVATLDTKESELRLQQRYTIELRLALQPLALPDWLAEFLPQVWGQALVLAASRDGADSDRAKRYRRVGRDLVMSIMPKGSPALRKKFLMALPPLMKDLNEGLQLVGWPAAAQRDFFGKLLPAHAASLKAPAQTELDHNMMVKQLEAIFNVPVPSTETLSAADPVPEVTPEVVEQRFSPVEAERVGLVAESAVDWDGSVDIAVGLEDEAQADAGPITEPNETAAARLASIPVDLDLASADPAEPSHGPQLFDHIKLGFAYQMHLKDEWQKVRLTHVSAGRSFFVFTRGKRNQETISMTARMLVRMCETGRMRAVESTYLMERATHRARKQLAAMAAG